MVQGDHNEHEKARKLMEIIEYEELRGDKELNYWIRYNMRFGSQHLINTTHRLSYRQIYDLDIKFGLVLILVLFYVVLKALINK